MSLTDLENKAKADLTAAEAKTYSFKALAIVAAVGFVLGLIVRSIV